MADDRSELESLRRLDELERKAAGKSAPTSPGQGAYRAAAKSLAEEGGGLAGVGPGAAMGAEAFAPLGLPGVIGGGLAGGALGYMGGKSLQEQAGKLVPAGVKEFFGFSPEQRAEERKQHPTASLVGETVVPLVAGGAPLVKPAYNTASELFGKARGAGIKDLASALREKTTGMLTPKIVEAQGKISQSEKVLREMERSPEIAANRVQPTDVSKVPQVAERAGVRERLGAAIQKAKQVADEAHTKVTTALNAFHPKSGVLPEDVGAIIQPAGRANIQSAAAIRTEEAITKIKDPAFAEAKPREAAGDFISTNPQSKPIFDEAINTLERQIEGTTEPFKSQLRARLQSLRGEEVPLSAAEMNAEIAKASSPTQLLLSGGKQVIPKTTKIQPITLEQAEFMRRMLTDKKLAEESGFAALDVSRRQAVAKMLSEAMKQYEPRVGEYLSKYRELSAPIEKATAGRGGALTEADLLAEQEVLFSADKSSTAKYYLDGSQERAERLLALTGGKKPEIVDAIKGYLRTQMEGMSSKEVSKFIKNNEGLLRVFSELKAPMESVAKVKEAAETSLSKVPEVEKLAKEASSRLTKALGTIESPANLARRVSKAESKPIPAQARFKTQQAQAIKAKDAMMELQSNLDRASKPQEVEAAVKSTAENLKNLGVIDEATRNSMLVEAKKLSSSLEDKAKAQKLIYQAISASLGYGVLGYGAKRYLQKGD